MAESPAIRQQGWRQGAVLGDALVADLVDRGMLLSGYRKGKPLCMVVFQTCDLIHDSFEAEPYFWVLPAWPVPGPKPDGNLTNAKNPRRYQFTLDSGEGTLVYESPIHGLASLDRALLANHAPSGIEIPTDELKKLLHWITLRFIRPAFPDAFNDRLRKRWQSIRKLTKKEAGCYLTGLYLVLDPDEELEDGKTYQISLLGAIRVEDHDDMAKRAAAEELIYSIECEMARCEGIDVVHAECLSEKDVTLHDLRKSRKWSSFDEFSLRSDDVGSILPSH